MSDPQHTPPSAAATGQTEPAAMDESPTVVINANDVTLLRKLREMLVDERTDARRVACMLIRRHLQAAVNELAS